MSAATYDEYYYVASVKGNFPWPDAVVRLCFQGNWFRLVPPQSDRYANVVLELPGVIPKGGEFAAHVPFATTMHRFLSALSWSLEASIEVHDMGGSTFPHYISGTRYSQVTMPVPSGFWLPITTDTCALRALGLVKEARAAQNSFPTVSFLWFYKAVEVCVGYRGSGPRKFYKDAVALLSGDARLIYDSLNLKTSLEEHMRGSRRHAIAHGEYSTSIDPDDVPSIRNTRFELPLIAQLAEIAIAQRFDLHHCAEMNRPGF